MRLQVFLATPAGNWCLSVVKIKSVVNLSVSEKKMGAGAEKGTGVVAVASSIEVEEVEYCRNRKTTTIQR